jgi:ketosteroid isomerase-like protein
MQKTHGSYAKYLLHAKPSVDCILAMNTTENKQLIEHVFGELSKGRTGPFVESLAEDVRWTFPGSWSWSGTWNGKQAVLNDLLQPLFAQFDDGYRAEADLILADGDHVVVQSRGHSTTRSGQPYRNTYCYIFRLREGRISEITEHCDTALVDRVLTPPKRRPIAPNLAYSHDTSSPTTAARAG